MGAAGAAVIIAFVNIILFVLLMVSAYNARRHKRGVLFNILRWTKKLALHIHEVVTKTPARKYGSLLLIMGISIIYTLHQKGIVGMHLLE